MKLISFMKKSIFWFWMLNGIVVSLMITGMYATESRSLTHSLKLGKVREALYGSVEYTTDPENRKSIQLGDNPFGIDLKGDESRWKYLYINMETDEPLTCRMSFFNNARKNVFERKVVLENGINKIDLPGERFSFVQAVVLAPKEYTFAMKGVQVREKERISIQPKHSICFVISLFLYALLIIGAIFIKRWKINFYKIIEVLQKIYIVVGDSLLWVSEWLSHSQKHILRITLLTFWQVFVMYMTNIGMYTSEVYYKYVVAVICIIIVGLSVLMLERPLKFVNWKKRIVFYWVLLSVVMCVSEYAFPKRYLLMGVVNLLLFGFLYFIWNNMEDCNQFLSEIISSLKVTFLIAITFSVCFRPMIRSGVYPGPVWNVNVFAMCLVSMILALLVEIQTLYVDRRNKRTIAVDGLLIMVAVSFVYLTGSRNGMLLTVIVIGLFLLHLRTHIVSGKGFRKVILIVLGMGILLLPVYFCVNWAVSHIPYAIGREVEFPVDNIKLSEMDTVLEVSAAEKESAIEEIVYAPALTNFLTGRNIYWIGYIRELNVIGHEYRMIDMKGWGGFAHNGILDMAYRYGIFAVVPYVFLFFSGLYDSFYMLKYEKNKRDKGYAFFVFGICILSFVLMMTENFERPFLITEWIVFYLMLGGLFSDSKGSWRA